MEVDGQFNKGDFTSTHFKIKIKQSNIKLNIESLNAGLSEKTFLRFCIGSFFFKIEGRI